MSGLNLRDDVVAALAACEAAEFYGVTLQTWEKGRIVEFEARQKMRFQDQLRLFVRRLLGVKSAPT